MKLFAYTDIEVSDDIQIFFIPNDLTNIFRSSFNDTNDISLKAIFQRIWKRL